MDECEIREYVGEILIAGFDGMALNDHARTLVSSHQIRNIILFSRNVKSMDQLKELNGQLQALARESGYDQPLLICTDQENGIVRRLAPGLPGLPGNMALGSTGNAEFAQQVALATAHQLRSAGVNTNLGPVLDVNNNPENPVIGVRSFGEDPNLVARLGCAMIEAMQGAGVIACAKHFPGHGDTATDSHLSVPLIAHSLERLNRVEFVPFRAAIEAKVDVIMSAHVVFPAVDPSRVVGTISRAVLTGLLREDLGFEGVICTDCLEMNAISETVGVGEGAVLAMLAGADMIMVSHRLDRQEDAIESLVQATLTGRLPLERLMEAAGRVRRMRATRLGDRELEPNVASLSAEALALQARICPSAVTIIRNEKGLCPIHESQFTKFLVLMDATVPPMSAADPVDPTSFLIDSLRSRFPHANVSLKVVSADTDLPIQLASIPQVDLIIAGLNGTSNRPYMNLLQTLTESDLPVVVIAMQSPYDLRAIPSVQTALAMYECTPWMADAVVRVLSSTAAVGRPPVTVF